MVSEEFVVSLYRILLDRTPEDPDAIVRHCQTHDESELLRIFLGSDEFLRRKLIPLPVGRHLHQDSVPVAVTASPEELDRMLEGIAEKWRRYGENEPHWSVIVSPDFLSTNIAQTIDRFYASGRGNVELALRAVRRAGADPAKFKTAVDFGCGVGRLTLALAGRVEFVTGIDISPGHLRLARERARETGIGNVEFEAISTISEIMMLAKTDFIISIIVLQHNPPPVIAELLRMLLRLLNPGGIAYIQVPTFIDDYAFDIDSYLAGDKVDMEMNSLPQRNVFEIIHEEGCIPLEVREDGWTTELHMISNTFLIRKM
jgi:2-polyprenyl-3-methyl-5-hydroxy-6-metoxy-1,4-benzoquinol methylase